MARGLDVTQLADLLRLSRNTVTAYEQGSTNIPADRLEKISEILGQPAHFFYREPMTADDALDAVHFRTRLLTKRAQEQLTAPAFWLVDYVHFLDSYVELPALTLPKGIYAESGGAYSLDQIEAAAQEVRHVWGLSAQPLLELTRAAELHGCIIQAFRFDSEELDGFSYWDDNLGRPFIWLNRYKGKYARSRFDLAHELGHMVLHRHLNRPERGNADFKRLESEAHDFAGALLLPEDTWAQDVLKHSRHLTLSHFVALKPKWRVSVGAMIARAAKLELIDEDDKTRLWKQYSVRKWRRNEPYDDTWEPESPELVREATEMIVPSGRYADVLASHFPLDLQDLSTITGIPREAFDPPPLVSRRVDGPIYN